MPSYTIDDLEKAHKTQLGNIITSWDFFYIMLKKYAAEGKTYANSQQVRDLNKLAIDTYIPITTKWIVRQIQYETRAFAPKSGLVYKNVIYDFIKRPSYQTWRNQAVKYITNKQ